MGQGPDGSNLPALYSSPWRQLGQDLRAVAADLRLRSRELLRRNGEGSLWSPLWWPTAAAAWFWPVVLAVVLTAFALLVAVVGPRRGPSQQAAVEVPPEQLAPVVPDTESPLPLPLPVPLGLPALPVEPAMEPAPDVVPESPGLAQPESPLASDPLQLLVERPEANGLIVAAAADASQARLRLVVRSTFVSLSAAEQQRRANQWQRWAAELGYDHLELLDSHAGLLAREALVGSGMIVLESSHRP